MKQDATQSRPRVRESASPWFRIFYWGADLTLLSQIGAPLGHRVWFYGFVIPWTEIAIGVVVREKRLFGPSHCAEHGGYGFTSDCAECQPGNGIYTEQNQASDRVAALALDLSDPTVSGTGSKEE